MTATVSVLCGLLVGIGVWLAATGLRRADRPAAGTVRYQLAARLTRPVKIRLAAACSTALLVGVVTRWPVAAVLAGLTAWALPAMFANRAAKVEADKLEAIASWTESLRSSLRAYAGVEQAIRDTAGLAPPAIRAQVSGLAGALQAGVRLPDALAAWQADVDHHSADLVAVALRRAAASSPGNLAAQLGWLAHAVRARVAAMARVRTARTEADTSARLVILIVAAVGVGLWLFNRPLLSAYSTPSGQIVLALVSGIWVAAGAWLRRLATIPAPTRILRPDTPAGGGPPR